MLTAFFGKSRPINYLIVGAFMVAILILHGVLTGSLFVSIKGFTVQFFLLILIVFSMLLADFINRKNDLTKKNTFVIFFFATLFVLFPETFLNPNVLIAHFFILLALRRIVSIKTKKDIRKKIFDAALWISVASCFDFWAFIFIAVLYYTIIAEAGNNFKNFVIPLLSFATVIILTNTLTLIFQNAFFLPLDWMGTTDFDYTGYNLPEILIPLSFIVTLTIWMLSSFIFNIKKLSKKNRKSTQLIIFVLAIAILIPVLSPQKSGSEFIYLAFPFSVFASKFIELPEEKFFKEFLLWGFLLMPFVLFFL